MTIYSHDILLFNFESAHCFMSGLTVASSPAYRFLWRQVRWSGILISLTIFHSIHSESVSCLVVSDCDSMDCSPPGSSDHGDSSGKNTGVDSLSLLQKIFLIHRSNLGLFNCREILYCLSQQGSPKIEAHLTQQRSYFSVHTELST